ncbi:MAG: DUF2627 domain-containing protein [Caldibacillus debilis]|nr:DUF2627 domain-containing protein [Caldibacillus debilis]MBO2481567.1 DUF2627 domain-containing protein [Bacillaceae bacterium]MBY6271201.1 DUF2627 domain-containing protein [Bacillaceae bacterium]OUM87709.1 MAG: hypothetical protein BAA03_08570 [Caldibacillus debilis]REJ14367.1 MAG: DUF2627 domain-containing protein [Caldibacillus debilis]REJ27255.1 MAG: DUF2627 domain-containing protein [Caldibacillus debilis]
MMRTVAFLILLVPGILAAWGVKLMRDSLFGIVNPPFPGTASQTIAGLLFFVFGIFFVGGFIFHRDKKRNKVQKRFKKR